MSDDKRTPHAKTEPAKPGETPPKTPILASPALGKPQPVTHVKAEEAVKAVAEPVQPSAEQILAQVENDLDLKPASKLQYHIIRVLPDDVDITLFNDGRSFSENIAEKLKSGSGTGAKVYVFYGWRIFHMTPTVTVGLTVAGQQKVTPLRIMSSRENPSGDVPEFLMQQDT